MLWTYLLLPMIFLIGCGEKPEEQDTSFESSSLNPPLTTDDEAGEGSGPPEPANGQSSDGEEIPNPVKEFAGLYEQIDNKAVKIRVENTGRIQSNLTVVFPLGRGVRLAPVFPHRLKKQPTTDFFDTMGFFNINAHEFENAELTADFYENGERLDITVEVTISRDYTLDDTSGQGGIIITSLNESCECQTGCLEGSGCEHNSWDDSPSQECSCGDPDTGNDSSWDQPLPDPPVEYEDPPMEPDYPNDPNPPSDDPPPVVEPDPSDPQEMCPQIYFNPAIRKIYTFHFVKASNPTP